MYQFRNAPLSRLDLPDETKKKKKTEQSAVNLLLHRTERKNQKKKKSPFFRNSFRPSVVSTSTQEDRHRVGVWPTPLVDLATMA